MNFPAVNIVNPGPNVVLMQTPVPITKRVTRVELTEPTIQNLLAGRGGILEIPTIGFSGLNIFHKSFWPYHFPMGNPGDQLWVPEEYRIVQSCQRVEESSSIRFENVVGFRDGTTRKVTTPSPLPLTVPKEAWAPEASMPPTLSRLHLGIQSITCSSDYSLWLVTLIHLNPVMLEFNPGHHYGCVSQG